MRMKTEGKKRARRGLRLPYLDNEEGMVLVITMVILLILSSIAATNIINSYLERSIAKNQYTSSVTLNAADAGIDHGLAWLNANPGSVPDHTTTPGWEQVLTAGLGSGGGYSATLKFKLEDEFWMDVDGDDDEIVMFNDCEPDDNCYAFTDSVYKNAGDPAYPVVEILSTGNYGDAGQRIIALLVARNGFDIKAYGAVTAGSNVNTTGNISVDGRAHSENGVLCDSEVGGTATCGCEETYPGVTVEDGQTVTHGGSADTDGTDIDGDGTPDPDAEISDIPGGVTIPFSPADALGLDNDNLADDQELAGMFGGALPGPGATKTSGNVTYINDNHSLNIDTTMTGIIIVHNPLFDPRVWRASLPTIPNPAGGGQVANPDYDPGNATGYYDAALDADYDGTKAPHAQTGAYAEPRRPRNIDQHGNATFKGVIISDSIDKINGTANVYGAMISLSSISTNILGNGSANVFYSCDAIKLYTAQNYSTKLSWQRRFN